MCRRFPHSEEVRMRITAIALGLVLGGTVPLVAQEATPGPPHEGIKVHGHWTIDVREPDGRLVTHREFENALTNGQRALAGMMTHTLTAIAWEVLLGSSPDPDPCSYSDGGPTPCEISEPSFPQEGAQPRSLNLQVALGTDSVVIL